MWWRDGRHTQFIAADGDQLTTTSQQVAAVFGKRHAHVLRAVENLLPQLPPDHQRNFGLMVVPVQIGSGATRNDPAYRITRDGFTLLAMGFTGKKALAFKLAYIDAFNAMAAYVKNQREGLTYRRAAHQLGCKHRDQLASAADPSEDGSPLGGNLGCAQDRSVLPGATSLLPEEPSPGQQRVAIVTLQAVFDPTATKENGSTEADPFPAATSDDEGAGPSRLASSQPAGILPGPGIAAQGLGHRLRHHEHHGGVQFLPAVHQAGRELGRELGHDDVAVALADQVVPFDHAVQ